MALSFKVVFSSSPLGGTQEITNQEDRWQILSIRGLNPPKGNINTLHLAGFDGARFNSEFVGTRNSVLTLVIRGNAETNRQTLLGLVPQKRPLKFLIENGTRAVYTNGYVDSVEVDPFAFPQVMQISIICPDPYFYDQTETTVTGSTLTVSNSSNFSQGYNFHIVPKNPTSEVSVRGNLASSGSGSTIVSGTPSLLDGDVPVLQVPEKILTIVYPFLANDEIDICTVDCQKSAWLTRGNTRTNLFPYITDDSTFFQLSPSRIPGLTVNTTLNYYGQSDAQSYISSLNSSASWRTFYLGV